MDGTEWTREDVEKLLASLEQAKARIAELEAKVAKLVEENRRLREKVDDQQRGQKRQAAPFSKGRPKKDPKRPGRKRGKDHGTHRHRTEPLEHEVTEHHQAPLPECCPACGKKRLVVTGTVKQFQTEIPADLIVRCFHIERGQCADCQHHVQGRHALQTADAIGAAGSQLGPRAHAVIAILNKTHGLSCGKIRSFFKQVFGLEIARATVARSLARTADRCEAPHRAIRASFPGAPSVAADETGWRIGGESAWLHVAVSEQATCFMIDPTRSARPLAELIGWDYPYHLVHDGWAPYERFDLAKHQTCLAHLMRRAHGVLEWARGRARHLPRKLIDLLQQGLALRDRWDALPDHPGGPGLSRHGLLTQAGKLKHQVNDLCRISSSHEPIRRLANFTRNHLDQLFTFLVARARGNLPLDATSFRAEQAIRPGVVNRKVWGGNRTERGAQTQSVMMTILATAAQHRVDPVPWIVRQLCSGDAPALLLPR